ncbi:HAD family hydrolase [Kitasatospora sp. NPDC004240]
MTPVRTALFDVDGTLVDTNYLHTLAWWEALRQYGHRVPMARIHRSVGMGADQLLGHLLGPDRDRDEDSVLAAAHGALFGRFGSVLEPLDGARDLLRECAARGWTVVLATSASSRELARLRRVLDADDAITAATHADDVPASKPAPDLVHAALSLVDGDPEHAVFVGDTVWDVRACRTAGVPCVGLESGGFSAAELLGSGALEVHPAAADLLAGLDDSVLARPRAFG